MSKLKKHKYKGKKRTNRTPRETARRFKYLPKGAQSAILYYLKQKTVPQEHSYRILLEVEVFKIAGKHQQILLTHRCSYCSMTLHTTSLGQLFSPNRDLWLSEQTLISLAAAVKPKIYNHVQKCQENGEDITTRVIRVRRV